MTELGRLERVNLRDVWQNEATQFTPWLADSDNISLLGETLGFDLEVESTEATVGEFRADIVCTDTSDNTTVLVENQLAQTDHSHVGQILTYAAGLDAVTIIWIAERVRDEHRAAIDWLNEVTRSSVQFFALEIELWKIGDSASAPKFNIVSKPNDWSQTFRAITTPSESTEEEIVRREWWAFLNNRLAAKWQSRLPKLSSRTFAYYGSANSGQFQLRASISAQKGQLQTALVINGKDALAFARLLEEEKEEIEREIGSAIVWQVRTDRANILSLERTGVNPMNRDDWPEHADWFAEHLASFRKAFWSRINGLDPAEYIPDHVSQDDNLEPEEAGEQS